VLNCPQQILAEGLTISKTNLRSLALRRRAMSSWQSSQPFSLLTDSRLLSWRMLCTA